MTETSTGAMTQSQRRIYLIEYLIAESPSYRGMEVPVGEGAQRRLLRSLVNLRTPAPIGRDFLAVQDEYLRREIEARGVTDYRDLTPAAPGVYLWKGDITTLRCGAIVNAANSGLTGCYVPCHGCIDNAIHTWAGVQLRLECARIMDSQGCEEPTGRAKLTPAYNLPCGHILHTVGPMVRGRVSAGDREALASCYRSCIDLARQEDLGSVAFCCISTGEFRFPNAIAARIAVETVLRCRGDLEVIFDVFSDTDYRLYSDLLRGC